MKKITNKNKFKKFLEAYYRLAKKRTNSIYGDYPNDVKKAEEISGFNSGIVEFLIRKYPLREIYLLTEKETQQNLDRKLKHFNEHYTPMIPLIKNFIGSKSNKYFDGVVKHFFEIFRASHHVDRYFRDSNFNFDCIGERILYATLSPESIINEYVSTAFYTLNDIYPNNTIQNEQMEVYQKDMRRMSQLREADEELQSRCKDYLLSLPQLITIDNLVEFNDLPEKKSIPGIGYNTNGSITQILHKESQR